jgi:two-component system, NtrC family, response regulator HydG
MDAQFPLLVANEATVAEQIRSRLNDSSEKNINYCTYEDYHDHVSWHRSGVVLLVVGPGNGDASKATSIVQEAQLRRSPLQLALIQLGQASESLRTLGSYVSCDAQWPDEMEKASDLLRSTPAGTSKKKSLADVIANQLMLHTPSLIPQAGRLALAASHDVIVLLTGETGTGKTYLARMLHEYSPRQNQPFLMVPCGAQPSNLFESTFFGHVKGAYTGAHQTRVGRFAAAGKGTILLDEIDALGLEQQASLLRVIETGEYELVGGNETFRSEARIIVASNADLAEEVEKDRFRQDLFYRLNVMSFHLPPLRKRRQDIPLLARGFVAQSNARFKKDLFSISPAALEALAAYDWPGNIRQLENVLQEAVLTSSGPELTVADLPQLPSTVPDAECMAAPSTVSMHVHNGHSNGEAHGSAPSDTLVAGRFNYERGVIQKTLAGCKFNRSRAARVLGVSRVTLYKKMKQYGLADMPLR